MQILNPTKKRFWLLLAIIVLAVLSFSSILPKPVLPFVQLPGEVYPESPKLFGVGITNTFVASLVAYLIVLIIALSARAWTRKTDEVPSGYYNFIEMIVETAYNFCENIAGSKARDYFPLFMTFFLLILTANWMGLVPGVDSIGIWEHKPTFKLHQEERAGVHFTSEEALAFIEKKDKDNEGNLRRGLFLMRTDQFGDVNAAEEKLTMELHGDDYDHEEYKVKVGDNPEAADWTIVPFLRPAATDLNFTLAFALVAMTMVQYYGFKYLGARDYLSKFFPFIGKGWAKEVGSNPIKAIDPVVGLLELVSEFSKILSFAFRLLGNIFAGMVLLFVMASLLPVANVAFFGLEFFVGFIQALVFSMLMFIFITSATVSHHGDHDDHH